MNMTAEDVNKALLRSMHTKQHLTGLPLIPGDSPTDCEYEVDMAVMCRSLRNENGDFDWLYGYLPYWDSNGEVLSAEGYRLLGAAQCYFTPAGASPIPVLAGLCPHDPFREHDLLLREAVSRGFSGVHNYPSVGLMEGRLRQSLEQQRLGYEQEVAFVRRAAEMNIYALALTFCEEDAIAMRDAGAGGILLHPGFTEPTAAEGRAYLETCREVRNLLPADTVLFTCEPQPHWGEEVAQSLLKVGGCYLCNMRHTPYARQGATVL